MSRSGYSDDCEDQWGLIRFRGAVSSAIRGKRGQQLLTETLAALDAMPEKALVAESLATADGEYCTLGVLGAARGIDMAPIDPEDWDAVAKAFGIAPALVREIVYENDEGTNDFKYVDVEIAGPMRPYYPDYGRHRHSIRVPNERAGLERWSRMRAWVASQIKAAA